VHTFLRAVNARTCHHPAHSKRNRQPPVFARQTRTGTHGMRWEAMSTTHFLTPVVHTRHIRRWRAVTHWYSLAPRTGFARCRLTLRTDLDHRYAADDHRQRKSSECGNATHWTSITPELCTACDAATPDLHPVSRHFCTRHTCV